MERQFNATRPNEKWVTDVTEFSVDGETISFASIGPLQRGNRRVWYREETSVWNEFGHAAPFLDLVRGISRFHTLVKAGSTECLCMAKPCVSEMLPSVCSGELAFLK